GDTSHRRGRAGEVEQAGRLRAMLADVVGPELLEGLEPSRRHDGERIPEARLFARRAEGDRIDEHGGSLLEPDVERSRADVEVEGRVTARADGDLVVGEARVASGGREVLPEVGGAVDDED